MTCNQMRKRFTVLLMFPTCLACTTQRQAVLPAAVVIDYEHVGERQDFSTQGAQEDYWARKLFQEHYRYQEYPRFSGTVRATASNDGLLIRYENDSLRLIDVDDRFVRLFTDGTLYPTVADLYVHRISTVEELKQSTNSPKRRRFTFLAYNPRMVNPTKYVFELTNPLATGTTDLPTFLNGAVLSFIRQGWIML